MNPNGGLDYRIHEKMGQFFTDQVVAIYKEMQENSCPIGQSRIFIAKFNCEENDAHFIISTVGPVYTEAEKEHAAFLLQSCYNTSLALANLYQLSSIAYPAISCGANRFPPHEAAQVAIESIRQFSYNVKDVRFILFERSIYEIFLQEWTDYAQRVNREANNTDSTNEPMKKSQIPPSIPLKPKSSARYCVLCKEEQLPIDRQLLCLICSELTRSEIFYKFLSRLRTAGEISYDELFRECQLLKPILRSYPLVYTPVQIFDRSIHQRDLVAEYYLESYCDKGFHNSIPMTVIGDGNCFYNTFVKLGAAGTTTETSTLTPVELRARNIVELILNLETYTAQYSHLAPFLNDFENYVRQDMVRDTNYASVWDCLSIPTVLNIHLISVYPKINGPEDLHYRYLNNALFFPLTEENDVDNQTNQIETSTVHKEVKLLFSHCNRPIPGSSKKEEKWEPNHFVPLLTFDKKHITN
jgi:O-acetyl-ADP-ribose deacetylase (regulator of RNase III)